MTRINTAFDFSADIFIGSRHFYQSAALLSGHLLALAMSWMMMRHEPLPRASIKVANLYHRLCAHVYIGQSPL